MAKPSKPAKASVNQTAPSPQASKPMSVAPPAPRLTAIDAYRGFVMFLLMAELLRIPQTAKNFKDSSFWQVLYFHNEHVAWTGCSLHDLIQPSFSFLVGVALPFSLAGRQAKGEPLGAATLHALWRSVLLVLLGVFLRSMYNRQTNWTFEDTLSQIGLGYFFLFRLGLLSVRAQLTALVVILIGYWAAFVGYAYWHAMPTAPRLDFGLGGLNDSGSGASPAAPPALPSWPAVSDVIAAAWVKNQNLASAFDHWFLNLFPREKPFVVNEGGYATLSFIPTLGTMILGLLAGGLIRRTATGWEKARWLVMAAVACLVIGYGVEAVGLCPSVKRIWTPAWTLVSGGYCFLFLAGFYVVLENLGWREWSYPLLVIGRNSIAIYVLLHQFPGFLLTSLKIHLGQNVFTNSAGWLASFVIQDPTPDRVRSYGEIFAPMLGGAAVMLILWGILFWMDRRKLYIKL